MADIRLEREFSVTPKRLFEVVSARAEVLKWWGHEGWSMRDEALDFTKTGPWHSAMISEEGNLFKLSGQVTSVHPNRQIAFTWAWHDPDDNRGVESHVTFTIQEAPMGSKLVIDHRELPSDDIAAQHARGWGSPLSRLERLLNTENL